MCASGCTILQANQPDFKDDEPDNQSPKEESVEAHSERARRVAGQVKR